MRRIIRKFDDKQRTKNSSNTEATLILCGSSGEGPNSSNTEANRGDTTITEEDEEMN